MTSSSRGVLVVRKVDRLNVTADPLTMHRFDNFNAKSSMLCALAEILVYLGMAFSMILFNVRVPG